MHLFLFSFAGQTAAPLSASNGGESKPQETVTAVASITATPVEQEKPLALPIQKNVAKLLLANTLSSGVGGATPVLQKVPNSNVITVVNAPGPLTIIKTLCVTSGIATAPQFTLVRYNMYLSGIQENSFFTKKW